VLASQAPFDAIIASDLVYIEEAVAPLVESLVRLSGPDTVLLYAWEDRKPRLEALFFSLLDAHFTRREVPFLALHPEYRAYDIHIAVIRKKQQTSTA
jgi:hypothetical protein